MRLTRQQRFAMLQGQSVDPNAIQGERDYWLDFPDQSAPLVVKQVVSTDHALLAARETWRRSKDANELAQRIGGQS